MANFL